jgi:uncharacterized protein
VIANPALMAIRCRTPEQMALVNTLCWVAEVGRDPQQAAGRVDDDTPLAEA